MLSSCVCNNVLDKYGEQPRGSLENLTNVRTEEEGRERTRRQLQLFPMAVFKREEDASEDIIGLCIEE